jgi:beta-barrel assembly-enhancing protease
MKSIGNLKAWFVALIAAAAAACTVNPVTGERELSIISPDQAVEMGIQQYDPGKQSQGGVYYLDNDLNDYVTQVGNRLASASEAYYLPYEFVVLNNGVPNAWALPGGKIAVNRGLLTELEDEAQLAAVLGHEVVHAAANHGASQMSRSTLLNIGLMAGGMLTQDSQYSDLISIGSQIGSAAWMASYGRNDELEADEHGMRYMSIVGYDPQAAVELQETFVRLSEGRSSDFISGLFASHPPSQQRVDANIAHAANLPAGGNRNSEEYQRAIAQILVDQPAYDAQDNAVEALNDKDPDLALEYLDEAVRLQPNEGQFWELRGHAWQMKDNLSNAETAFGTAIDKNPEYFQHWLVRGLLRKDMGKNQLAQSDLERAEALLPTSSSSYALGELAEARNDMDSAMSYFSAAASGGGTVGQLATAKIVRYELPTNPSKYIASGLSVDGAGRILVLVRNDSGVAITNVKVRLVQTSDGLYRDFDIAGTLEPNQQGAQNTGIVADPELFQVLVIAANAG